MSLQKKKHRFAQKIKYKPKVLIIHPSVGLKQSGAQIFVQEIAEALKCDFEITVLSNAKLNSSYKKIPCIPRTSSSFKLIKKILSMFCSSPEIVLEHLSAFLPTVFELLFNKYDIVFPNNDWGGLCAASFARKFKKFKLVYTEHCGMQNEARVAKRNLKYKADKYIILSDSFKDFYRKNKVNFTVIKNGVNLSKFNPDILPADLNLKKPIICVVGRNTPDKRLGLALSAAANIKDISLLLVSPDGSSELETLGQTLLADRFKMIKAQYEEMPFVYKACDLFTLPSKDEPFGLVYLEAMACNLPVVAPSDEQRRHIVGNAGLFCDVTDLSDYSETLKTALQKDWHNKPFFQAKKFSIEKTAKEYTRVFKSLL